MQKEKRDDLLKISEFSEIAEMSRKGLIFYDNIGVFSPEYTAPNGYRYYSHEQIYLISVVNMLKELDTPLQQIKAYMQDDTSESAVDLLEKQGSKLQQKIEHLLGIQDMLQIKLKRLKIGMEMELSKIRIVEQEELPLFISEPFQASKDRVSDEIWIDFYRKCKAHGVIFGYPEGFMVSHENLCAEKTHLASHIICHVGNWKYANASMPAGKYLTVCGQGRFDDTEPLYRVLLDYARKQGYTIIGHGYEERLVDEIASKNKNVQRIEVKIQIDGE